MGSKVQRQAAAAQGNMVSKLAPSAYGQAYDAESAKVAPSAYGQAYDAESAYDYHTHRNYNQQQMQTG